MQAISTASIILTENCNMACGFCYERSKTPSVMNKETVKNAINFLAANRNKERLFLMWFGGEPLTNFEVLKYGLTYAKSIMSYNLTHLIPTNGTIWTDEIEQFAIDNPNITIQVSWQGLPELQEDSRGFATLVESNIKRIVSNTSNPFRIQMQILPNMVHQVVDAIDYIASVIGNRGNIIVRPVPEAEGWLMGNTLEVFEQQIALACSKHGNVLKKVCDAEEGLTSNVTYCGVGSKFCAIVPAGDIYPCHRFYFQRNQQFKLGNLKTGFVKSNVANVLETCTRDSIIGCNNCKAYDLCYICPACNYEESKNFFVPSYQNCEVNKAYVSGIKQCTDQFKQSAEQLNIIRDPNINSEETLYQVVSILVNLNNSVIVMADRIRKLEDQIKFIGRM